MKLLPEKLLNELTIINGFDHTQFVTAHQQNAITSLRLHPQKTATVSFESTEKVPWSSYGVYLKERPTFTVDPLFHAGAYYVQEASSMFLERVFCSVFPQAKRLKVLDLCAAPGGKSTLLATLIGENSLLISNEVIRNRASILEENCVRWGYTNNWVTSNDPKDFGRLKGYFDCVVIDAPCSGSGLFRKEEEALKQWNEENVQLCAARQKRIIADVWESLKENGVIIYATCSYSPQENEAILDWMASEWEVETLKIPLQKEWNITATLSDKHSMEGYRFFPNKLQGEGFFIAAIRKKTSTQILKFPKPGKGFNEKIHSEAARWLTKDDWHFLQEKEEILAFHAAHYIDYLLLKQYVYFRKIGVNIGTPKNKDWIPHHELALCIDKQKNLPSVAVNKESALRFLKKEELPELRLEKGWHLVNYEGLSLGWIKSLGNRMNNYLPKHWRIRMELPKEDWA